MDVSFRVAAAALLGALILLPWAAGADSAAPREYRITVTGTSVAICADPYGGLNGPGRPCPDQGLLRRNVQTGETVLITTCDVAACFADECVPPGTYQYGLLEPLVCSPSAAGTTFFGLQEVSAPVAGCQRTQAAPAAFSGAVPWGSCPFVCGHSGQDPCGSNGFWGGLAPDLGCGGCAAGPAGVLGLDAAALVAGLLLWARRGRRRPPSP